MAFSSFISDVVEDLQLLNPEHEQDAFAYLPFVGGPFAYNQYRQGRGSWGASALGIGIGVGVTEFVFYMAGTRAGFTSTQFLLGRSLSALGLRHSGRSYLAYAFFGGRPGAAARFGWGVPGWAIALGIYEYGNWLNTDYRDWYMSNPGAQERFLEVYG
jgi:hypothetical protein